MTLTQLKYIVAVERYRSFADAAKNSFVTQPTLSMQVQKLEGLLDVEIFDRSKQPVIPTEIGKKIIEQAKIILREATRLEYLIQESKNLLRGEYKLGIIPTLASSLLPAIVGEFTKLYPEVNLIIDELKTEDIIHKLENDEIDAGIAATPLGRLDLKEDVLFYEPFFVFLNNNSSLYSKKLLHPKDLINEKLWLMSEGHCFRDQVMEICKVKKKNSNGQPGVQYEGGSFETLVKLVENKNGVTLLPQLSWQSLETDERKRMIRKFAHPEPVREVSLVVRRALIKRNVTEALKEIILKNIPDELKPSKQKKPYILTPS